MSPVRVCIFTSVHRPDDVRVFHKEALTLAAAGYEVKLVAPGDGRRHIRDGVEVIELPRPRNRWQRLTSLHRLLRIAARQRAHVYHFHDPELLPVGYLLHRLIGCPVIYDSHENYPETAYERAWYPGWAAPLVSHFVDVVESLFARRVSVVITVVRDQDARFRARGCRTVMIRNLPRRDLFPERRAPQPSNRFRVIYVGGLTEARGVFALIDLAAQAQKEMSALEILAVGPFNEPHVERRALSMVKEAGLSDQIRFTGYVSHSRLWSYMKDSHVGIIPFLRNPKLMRDFLPTKLFEYAASALPVVASDIPSLRHFVGKLECGVLVPPGSPRAFLDAIISLRDEPERARVLGDAGRRHFLEEHNWEREGERLVGLYQQLLDGK